MNIIKIEYTKYNVKNVYVGKKNRKTSKKLSRTSQNQ